METSHSFKSSLEKQNTATENNLKKAALYEKFLKNTKKLTEISIKRNTVVF